MNKAWELAMQIEEWFWQRKHRVQMSYDMRKSLASLRKAGVAGIGRCLRRKKEKVEYAIREVARNQITESSNSQCCQIQRAPFLNGKMLMKVLQIRKSPMCTP